MASLRRQLAEAYLANIGLGQERSALEMQGLKTFRTEIEHLLARVLPEQRLGKDELEQQQAMLRKELSRLNSEVDAVVAANTRRAAEHERLVKVGARALLQSGRAEFVNDTATDTRAVPVPGTAPPREHERLMVVPLLGEGNAVQGAMAVWRSGGAAFDGRDLDFLSGLSRQAVIALHNARLFDETREALEQQTASAEVLRVISGSMADAQPVFERILDSCERLFGTQEIGICLARDGMIDFPAYRGKCADMIKAEYPRPLAGSVTERVMVSGEVEHVADASADDMPAYVSRLAASYANFSLASAPMLWQGQGIGTIDIARSPPRPFSDKELALLRTFADQAVVAIQNARLFNETREALEQQTASAGVRPSGSAA